MLVNQIEVRHVGFISRQCEMGNHGEEEFGEDSDLFMNRLALCGFDTVDVLRRPGMAVAVAT